MAGRKACVVKELLVTLRPCVLPGAVKPRRGWIESLGPLEMENWVGSRNGALGSHGRNCASIRTSFDFQC